MSKSKVTFGQAFKTIIWPRKKLLFIGLFLIVISKASGLVTPIIMKTFVNDALERYGIDSSNCGNCNFLNIG